jgi:hypothetical protein
MSEFSMDGKEVVALDEDRLQQLRCAGFSEVEDLPERGVMVDGKFKVLPITSRKWVTDATHEVRVFKKLLETGFKGKLSFVNKTDLEEFVFVVVKL